MIIPIRCFTCGKPIAHKWEEYNKRINDGESASSVLTDLGLERNCCRAAFLGQADNIELISNFKKA